jgi:hypothetical protein
VCCGHVTSDRKNGGFTASEALLARVSREHRKVEGGSTSTGCRQCFPYGEAAGARERVKPVIEINGEKSLETQYSSAAALVRKSGQNNRKCGKDATRAVCLLSAVLEKGEVHPTQFTE